jgi:hypothetical protein
MLNEHSMIDMIFHDFEQYLIEFEEVMIFEECVIQVIQLK